MTPNHFAAGSLSYAAPRTIDEGIDFLAPDGAHVLAGGTDIVLMRATSNLGVSCLVDAKSITSLSQITRQSEHISIGSTATLDSIARCRALGHNALVDGAALVGGWQTRSRATLGGNICRASPAGDTLCGLLVLGGRLRLVSGAGTRTVPSSNFFTGPGSTVRARDELLVSIDFGPISGGSAYDRFTYRNAMDLAVVGVAARISVRDGICDEAQIAIGACGPTPMLVPLAAEALVGSAVDGDAVEAACSAVAACARPIDDVRGTVPFRLHVLAPLTRRVISRAFRRATADRGELS